MCIHSYLHKSIHPFEVSLFKNNANLPYCDVFFSFQYLILHFENRFHLNGIIYQSATLGHTQTPSQPHLLHPWLGISILLAIYIRLVWSSSFHYPFKRELKSWCLSVLIRRPEKAQIRSLTWRKYCYWNHLMVWRNFRRPEMKMFGIGTVLLKCTLLVSLPLPGRLVFLAAAHRHSHSTIQHRVLLLSSHAELQIPGKNHMGAWLRPSWLET